MSYLYKIIRLQSMRFIALGLICLMIFGSAAIYVSPAIIARFRDTPPIDLSLLNINAKYSLELTSRNTFRPYSISFSHLDLLSQKIDNQETQYLIGTLPQALGESIETIPSALLIRADITEKLHANSAFTAYIQPIDLMLTHKKEDAEIKRILSQLTDEGIPINPYWIITTDTKSEAFGFAVFVLVLSLIPLLLLFHGARLFLSPDRQRELRYQRKFYFEDITALSQDFNFEIQNNLVIRLKKADIFQDFIVVKTAFHFYIIPLESLVMLYPTRKFIFHSLLWFIPKSGIAVYEEERAYFVRLPAISIHQVMHHLQQRYPYIDLTKNQNHLRHAKNPAAVWQDYLDRKSQYQNAQQKDHYYV